MFVAFTASWHSTEASRILMACLDAGFDRWFQKEPNADPDRAASLLGVDKSRISAMRSGLDPGPGILRFASLPAPFWIGFITEWGVQFCVRVITDAQIDKLIAWQNYWMVNTMKRDMAKAYPPEVLAEDTTDEPRTAHGRRRA